MSRFVRESKVRHVFCEPPRRPEGSYEGFRLSTATGDHNYIKGNTRYFGITVASGGGSLAVIPYEKTGKQPAQLPVLDGHKGPVLDFDFNPFHEHIVATGGDDATIKVWGIKPGGMDASEKDPLVDMKGHQRKITVMRFHPTSEHVIITGSLDNTVKLWDIEKGMARASAEAHPGMVNDIVWSEDGSRYVTSCKDKMVRLFDAKSEKAVATFEAHTGTKATKLEWLAKRDKFVTAGFTRQSKRQFFIWDPKKLDTPLASADIDQAAGVLMPFYDPDVNLLYLAGKGDGNVRYYEIVDDQPWQFEVGQYRAKDPCRGMAICPKRIVNVEKCEVTRLLKLSTSWVEPLSMIVPRKSDLFQDDIFPDCYAGKAAQSADDFFSGKVKKPVLMSLDPSKRKDESKNDGDAGGMQIKKKKTTADLQMELDAANRKIAELEALLKKHNISA